MTTERVEKELAKRGFKKCSCLWRHERTILNLALVDYIAKQIAQFGEESRYASVAQEILDTVWELPDCTTPYFEKLEKDIAKYERESEQRSYEDSTETR